jgi:type II secretory pathway pseudopilin PulG
MIKRLIVVMLILSLMVPILIASQTLGQTQPKQVQVKERHPAIRAAIAALEKAKYDLEHAAHDFGGHRAEALEAVNRAIVQLRKALEYDRK